MHLSEIGKILGCGVEDAQVEGFAFDSRLVKKGDLFFALRGQNFDGHSFLREVAAKGAVAAVVEKGYMTGSYGLKLLHVEDTAEALQKLAKEVQARRKGIVIDVTGSAGKTTTKEYIATLLAKKFKVGKTPGNSNSQMGLPLAILNGFDEEVLVIEMGMTEKGQIKKLVDIIPPDIAVITKIGVAHIGYFSDGQEGIAEAKAEIFSHPRTKARIIPALAKQYRAMQNIDAITFGVYPEGADFVLKTGFVVEERGEATRPFSLPFEESHFCEDFIAAAAVCRTMGLSWDEILEGVGQLKSLSLRFEKIQQNGILFINDCYNAQLDSITAAFNNMPKPKVGGKVIVVFGEITDLGTLSEKSHRQVAEKMLHFTDHLLCYGKGCLPMLEVFSEVKRPAEFFRSLNRLKEAMFDLAKPGDVVLIKGSRINQLWQLLE